MIRDNALVFFKNKAALVRRDGDRLELSMADGSNARVRDKDVELVHPGPVSAIPAPAVGADFQTAWEMSQGQSIGLTELAELVFGKAGPAENLACRLEALDGAVFRAQDGLIYALSADERRKEEEKRAKKEGEAAERAAFVARARAFSLLPEDGRFLGEVEALALGKTQKSRTAADIGAGDGPESAQLWLMKAGIWDWSVNPWPSRSGHPSKAPELELGPDDDRERLDLSALEAWAIDNAWSHDPDDALSWDGQAVWVHVADPASVIVPDSPADREAMDRSGTLYLPEGPIPMLPDEALARFGLGLSERSRALSFRIELQDDGQIASVSVQPSWVRVTRTHYEAAGPLMGDGPLSALAALAEKRRALRLGKGAVDIAIPEVRVWLDSGKPAIQALADYPASALVREMMVLAGEAAARWAFDRGLPFPYYSQEAPGSSDNLPPGLAGEFAKRRLMRGGMAGTQPRAHQGLGVSMYAQVTSPLRRYGDLLAHQQIRAALGLSGAAPLPPDELSMRLARAQAGAQAVRKAERQSELHWTLAYLAERPGWTGTGIVVQGGQDSVVYLPELGLETRIKGQYGPNEELRLRFLKADPARMDASFGVVAPEAGG